MASFFPIPTSFDVAFVDVRGGLQQGPWSHWGYTMEVNGGAAGRNNL